MSTELQHSFAQIKVSTERSVPANSWHRKMNCLTSSEHPTEFAATKPRLGVVKKRAWVVVDRASSLGCQPQTRRRLEASASPSELHDGLLTSPLYVPTFNPILSGICIKQGACICRDPEVSDQRSRDE